MNKSNNSKMILESVFEMSQLINLRFISNPIGYSRLTFTVDK